MRKILFLAVFLMLAAFNTSFAGSMMTNTAQQNSAAAQQNKAPAVVSLVGEIKEVTAGNILVEYSNKKMGNTVLAHMTDTTYIYDAEHNKFIGLMDLKSGQKVTVYHSPAMTRSIPPQTTAFAVVVGSGHDVPRYYRVNDVAQVSKGTEFLTDNGGLIIREPKTDKAPQIGDELLVWHGPVAMSMPGQTTATKIINLSNMKKGKVTMHLAAGVLTANGKEIQVTQKRAQDGIYRVFKQGKTYMVPLAPIAQSFDINITLEQDKGVVIVSNGSESAVLNLGSKKCKFAGEYIELSEAPKLKNGEVIVPLDFFTKVLNIKVELLNTPV